MRNSNQTAVVAVLIGCILAGAILLGGKLVNQVNQQSVACQQVNVLRKTIVQVLQNGEAALPHSPYFKDKPKLLAQAESQYQADVAALKPVKC